ncbi:MAG TPA: hypothetical protein VM533_00215 [Fimbriiglobus sp.]|jgi:hypothetical protein|nr:hypothetical protein [Fimbriiglobus sp.]
MNVGVLRLGFAVFWLTVAGVVYFRDELVPGAWGQAHNLDLGALLALALAGWNLMRWYLGRRRVVAATPGLDRRRRPLEPRGDARVEEYNPEFDFNKPANPER